MPPNTLAGLTAVGVGFFPSLLEVSMPTDMTRYQACACWSFRSEWSA